MGADSVDSIWVLCASEAVELTTAVDSGSGSLKGSKGSTFPTSSRRVGSSSWVNGAARAARYTADKTYTLAMGRIVECKERTVVWVWIAEHEKVFVRSGGCCLFGERAPLLDVSGCPHVDEHPLA